MISLAGYQIKEEIYSGEKCLVYRARENNKSVIIKILRADYPEPSELAAFKNEYEILKNINSKGVIRVLGVEKYKNGIAIVLEDIGGKDLSQIFESNPNIAIEEIIRIMILSVNAISEIHKLNIVHGEIKSQNIIYNPSTNELQIIDFDKASFLSKQNSFISLNSSLEKTLAYISPEQTGRMNRYVDYRTDYYSLGITFYKLITGELPFLFSDPMELVHAHIARTPTSPIDLVLSRSKQLNDLESVIYRVLSDIIMKLLQKNPEDRYQSSEGIAYDLEWCLQSLLNKKSDLEFQIARNDFSSKFQIPEKLYGRTKEIVQIVKIFKRIAEANNDISENSNLPGKPSLLLISGRSGIGKSMLINEVNRAILEYKGYFASGRYDRFKQMIPYFAITNAFQILIQQILTENEQSIFLWRETLQNALGANGKLIVEVIPELETLLGEQPPVVELGLVESQNRFHLVFQNFIQAFCIRNYPIAIFLDDVQWADFSSIKLIHTILLDTEIKNLFIILSFRDNEIQALSSFSVLLDKLKERQFPYKEIFLDSITISDIAHMVRDTLNCDSKSAKELASIIFEKTKGNPFFVNEMFKNLYAKNLICYSDGTWTLKINKIREEKISENVIDLMIEKVQVLKLNQVGLLKLASCIGDSFSLSILAGVSETSIEEVKLELIKISNEGFLFIRGDIIHFVHSKVREAIYSLISDEDKIKNHYAIGVAYLRETKESELEDLVFIIVNQMNLGSIYASSIEEKKHLLKLNHLAGTKSLASTAYDAANGYFENAVQYLPKNSWEIQYEKTLSLYLEKAQAEYLSTNYQKAEFTFDLILKNAKKTLDIIRIYELKSVLYTNQLKMASALSLAIEALKILNVSLPKNPNEFSILPEIILAKIKIRGRNAKDFISLPLLKDSESLAVMQLLNACIAPAYLSKPPLFPVLVMKMVNLTLRKGITSISPFAFMIFGMILGVGLGDFSAGYEWGQLAISLMDKYDFRSIRCRTLMVYGCAVNHWVNHAKTNEEYIISSIQSGIENGDLEYAGYSLIHITFQALAMRKPLIEVLAKFEKMKPVFIRIKQDHSFAISKMIEQATRNLMEPLEKPYILKGEIFDEDITVPKWIETNNASALHCYYTMKSVLGFLFQSPENVYEFTFTAQKYEASNLGTMFVPEILFFESLILSRLFFSCKNRISRIEYKRRIQKIQSRMKKWGENCPANYGHKLHIINGLIYEIKGNQDYALKEYKLAILLAKEHEYILEEAIANELIAKIWKERKEDQFANLLLAEAYYAFKRWGCQKKLEDFETRYPQIKRQFSIGFNMDGLIGDSALLSRAGSLAGAGFLDLNTVIKASQAISSEIHLGKLLEKMMKILFENAGAEKGYFILRKQESFYIVAAGTAGAETINVKQSLPLEKSSDLSAGIVNYVVRTKNLVILNDAIKNGIFINDPYVKENAPKSILCHPIINQGNLVGVVYLENNLTTEAFTSDRVKILEILSSQVAVSIENSLLYENLEEKVEDRTKDLNNALVEVQGLKEQQDGDYFLNTLLIEPLGKNNATSETIHIEFFLEQKKKFIFRGSAYELGGDINISENLLLQGRKYTVFLNGDAMGKSIQGAGGVLVLGTVFKSIIQRTLSTFYGNSMYPERWLKSAFIETHKVFESFDGSMLMSAVFGLIDDMTGTMYFINAEQPDIVLYRNGVSSFIFSPHQYTKLGSQGQTGSISIGVFSLQPNDIIILGSDGRDDLILGKEADGVYDIINSDPNLFLEHVEKGGGDLKSIVREIMNTGTLMDDLSLLKIQFKGEPLDQNRLEENLRLLEKYRIEEKNKEFLELGLEVIANYPHLTDLLYEISLAFTLIKEYEKAIDFGERVKLRNPKKLENLLNLIKLYQIVGNFTRAKTIIELGLKFYPDDKTLSKIKIH